MISTHECINRIQQLLSAGQAVTREEVAELVWAYAKACRELNEKAERCLAMLRQGKRPDAAQLAKQPPDLAQELRLLDFPERATFLDLCEGAGLPIAQTLDSPALNTVVEEVYSEGGALDSLLKSFKRMSLGRAPLADRVRVLRLIKQADPQQDVWDDDIRTFEAARLAEMVKQAEEADMAGDVQTLENILAELGSGEWLAPPQRQIAAIERIIRPHRQRYALARFDELAKALHVAHGAMDSNRCRSLLGEWKAVIQQTGVEPATELKEAVAPVEEWLAAEEATAQEEDRFGNACGALEKAMDEKKDRPTLEKLAAEVLQFERGMPEALATRYNGRLREFTGRVRRRFALTLTAIIGGFVLVASGVTVGVLTHLRQSELEHWRSAIASALNSDDLDGASKLLGNLANQKPDLLASPDIAALSRLYEQKSQEEVVRCEKFKQLQADMEKNGPAATDKASLESARRVARTPQERDWLEKWSAQCDQVAVEQRTVREEAFREKLQRLGDLYAAFVKAKYAGKGDLDAWAKPCLDLTKELAAADVSKPLLDQVAETERNVLESLTSFRKSADKRQALQEAIDRLPSLAGNLDELATALAAFSGKYPEQPLAAQFTKAVAMAPQWKAARAWKRLADGWGGQIRLSGSAGVVDRWTQVEEYLKANPGGYVEAPARAYQTYLRTVLASFPEGRLAGMKRVRDILSHPVFAPDVRMIVTTDSCTYYVLQKDLTEQKANGVCVGYTCKYLKSVGMATDTVRLLSSQVVGQPAACPGAAFAEAASQRLDQFQGAGWETFYLSLAAIAQDQKAMDPVLTAQMVKLFLGFASATALFRVDEIKQRAALLAESDPDSVEWLDPTNTSARLARRRIEQALKAIGPLQPLAADVEKRVEAMVLTLRPVSSVGILLGGTERVMLLPRVADQDLYVLWGEAGEQPALRKIGSIQGGKWVGDASALVPYPQGTPVLIRN